MKNIGKILKSLSSSKPQIIAYCFLVLGFVLFSLVSFGLIMPVLQVLFDEKPKLEVDSDASAVVMFTQKINEFIANHDKMTTLFYVVVIIVIATILKNLFLYGSLRVLNPIRNQVIRRLRDDMFTKTLSLPIGFFNEERKGDLVSKMTNDINEVEVSIISVLEVLFREPLMIIFTIASMLFISVELTLFIFIFLPLAGLIIGRVSKLLKKPSNLAQEQLSNLMTNLDETIAGMRVVKSFNAERVQQLKFRKINNTLYKTRNKLAARREAASPLSETLGILVVGIIILVGGYLIVNEKGTLTGSVFITYVGLFYLLINPLKNLSNAFFNIQKGSAALERINALLEAPVVVEEQANALKIKDFKESIEFRNVDFYYGEKQILKNINLNIKKGTTVALVGASGAGKSTLADLIPRFHDVTNGQILIDGVDIRTLNLYSYRKLIGMVTQDPILFNDSISENIQLGTGGKTSEEIIAAAKVANAHNFIIKKPEGYDTVVGDRGMKLSGGERQRTTIARAVLKNPPILILDEATSALDTESEQLVQYAINNLMKNRTAIVIAHRLSTIRHADEIIVMHQGEIVERGTHDALIQQEGYYHNLVSLQQLA